MKYIEEARRVYAMAKNKLEQLRVEIETRISLQCNNSRSKLPKLNYDYRHLLVESNQLHDVIEIHDSNNFEEEDDFDEVVDQTNEVKSVMYEINNPIVNTNKGHDHHPYSAAYVEVVEIDELEYNCIIQ